MVCGGSVGVGRGGSNENRMGRKGDSSGGSRQRNKSSLRIKGWRSMVRVRQVTFCRDDQESLGRRVNGISPGKK